MKYLLLLALIGPVIYFAARQRKWYLYILIALIGILPEQFAIHLHDNLPLLTASRLLILLVASFWLYDRIQTKKWSIPLSLAIFLGVNLLLSLIHLFSDTDEINRMFIFVMERALVVVMLRDLLTTQEEFDRGVDFLIAGSCILAVIGIIQTVFDYDISTVLHLTKTISSVQLLPRMGLTRAFGTLNAISYGCYCGLMLIPIYYRLQQTDRQRYSVAFALNLTAMLYTFTRSAWLCIVAILGILFLTRPKKFLRSIWKSLVFTVALSLLFCLIQPKLGKAVLETGKSSVNTILQALPEEWFEEEQTSPATGDGTTSSTEPAQTQPTEPEAGEKPSFTLSEDFGANGDDPAYSRNVQWTAVEYMIQEGTLVLGYGYNALPEGKIHFFYDRWGTEFKPTSYLDVGWVAVIAEGGLVYLAAFLGLLAYVFIQSLRRRKQVGDFSFYKMSAFMVPYLLIVNVLAAFLNAGVVWLFFGLFYAYENLDRKQVLFAPAEQADEKWRF